jgi:hypothetical protein
MNVIEDAHGVSKISVSRTNHLIAKNIAENIGLYIQFPMTNTERQSVMFNFYDIKEFPPVLGEVDGTLIPILINSLQKKTTKNTDSHAAVLLNSFKFCAPVVFV